MSQITNEHGEFQMSDQVDSNPNRSLTIRSNGTKHTATLNGEDITHSLTTATIVVHAGKLPQVELRPVIVELRPVIVELEVDADHTRVHVPADTADLLVQLGWKPPAHPGWNTVVKLDG